MFATGFSMAAERIAEPEGGPSEAFLTEAAAAHQVWVVGSVPQRNPATGRPRNVAVLAGPDGSVHRYAKIHPFSFAGEHEHYEAGRQPLIVTVEGVRISLFVCYDLRFADEFWALAGGTDCYLVVANWPAARREHWRALLVARAIENQAYVAGVNRVGTGDGIDYAGDSMLIDPFGAVLVHAAHTETVLVADVDPNRVSEVRARYPFLTDRRTTPAGPPTPSSPHHQPGG